MMRINKKKQEAMERQLGCTFCENGIFAEMIADLSDYEETTKTVPGIEYRFFDGSLELLKEKVALVDEEWPQYFEDSSSVFCGYQGDEVVSFCIVVTSADTILDLDDKRVGSIGCVGTVPVYRSRGIGLRMVDLATLHLKKEGCEFSGVSYTHIADWYAQLGYVTFARFSFPKMR